MGSDHQLQIVQNVITHLKLWIIFCANAHFTQNLDVNFGGFSERFTLRVNGISIMSDCSLSPTTKKELLDIGKSL